MSKLARTFGKDENDAALWSENLKERDNLKNESKTAVLDMESLKVDGQKLQLYFH